MAVAFGLVSSFSRLPISASSSLHPRDSKFASSSLQILRRQQFEIQQRNCVKGKDGIVPRNSSKLRKIFLFKHFISFATSEEKISPSDPSPNNSASQENISPSNPSPSSLVSEKCQDVIEDYSFSSSCYLTWRTEGKPGFISFHGIPYQRRLEGSESTPRKEASKVVWFVGPTVLVAFLVIPSLYLRQLLSLVLEDSLLTDFLILFFTEALFYGGVAIFVLLVDLVWRPSQQVAPTNVILPKPQYFRISSVATLVLSLIIPLLTMGMVWPWTGPAASATLAPYLVGLVVQFAFEQYGRRCKSPAWPVIPVIFQVYRLHQLNRAAQLVTALTFSVKGAETTSQTLAITNSLGALGTVLQILGVICIWSLSSFLMRFLPSAISES